MEKLFYKNTHMTEFTSTVTECIPDEKTGRFKIVLNCTAFFPEEGGQVADKGVLIVRGLTEDAANSTEASGVYPVLDVRIAKDIIYHYTDTPISPGQSVTGKVDWAQRFDFMQQHSGEHIISGLVNKHYGFDNVGFHLGLTEVTLDFNGSLSLEQLRGIEEEANAAVWANLPVLTSFPSPEELALLAYRSKLDLTENVRIVEIPGIDTCACCAPHVDSTGQIGLIKITNVQSHRGGVRVNILCGGRAVADYTKKQDSVTAVSVLLSAKQEAVDGAVSRLQKENTELKERANTLQAQLLEQTMKQLPSPEETSDVLLFVGDLDNIAMRNAVNSLTAKYTGFCGIFAGDDTSGYRFIIGSSREDCRELAAGLRRQFQAKGGGSAPMIQGSVTASKEDIRQFIENKLFIEA